MAFHAACRERLSNLLSRPIVPTFGLRLDAGPPAKVEPLKLLLKPGAVPVSCQGTTLPAGKTSFSAKLLQEAGQAWVRDKSHSYRMGVCTSYRPEETPGYVPDDTGSSAG